MKKTLRTGFVLGMALMLAVVSLPGSANAEDETYAAIFEAVRQELRSGPWTLEEVTLGESREEGRGIMLAVAQQFTALVRGRVPRFQVVDQNEKYMIVDMVADPDRTTPLQGVAQIVSGPGMTEVEIVFADPDMVLRPGEILQRLPIRDQTVLLIGTPEADEAKASMAAQREVEMAEFIEAFGGDWAGMKTCGEDVTELRLSLKGGEEHRHLIGTAAFQRASLRQNSNIFSMGEGFGLPSGSFTVKARFNENNGRVRFDRDEWIDQSGGHSFRSDFVLVSEGTGDDATLVGTDHARCQYRLARAEVFAAEREPYLAPFRAVLEAVELGTWIESVQIGPVDASRDNQREWPMRIRVESISDYHIALTAEITVFGRNSGNAVGETTLPLMFLLREGADTIRIRSGTLRYGSTNLRHIYLSNRCPGGLNLEGNTIIMSGPGAENPACMEEMRFLLVPPS